jgi:hypothetical protein
VISLVFQVFPEHDLLGETVQEWICPHCDGTNSSSERGRLVRVQPWYGRGPDG